MISSTFSTRAPRPYAHDGLEEANHLPARRRLQQAPPERAGAEVAPLADVIKRARLAFEEVKGRGYLHGTVGPDASSKLTRIRTYSRLRQERR